MQLGDLEKQVLHTLWQQAPASAKEVYAILSKSRDGSLNTIQSTLDRLFKKELLSRAKEGHAWYYSPRIERRQLIAKMINQATEEFAEHQQSGLIAAFASMSEELDAKQLDELEAMIQERRQALEGR